MKLYVGNLPYALTEEELSEFFESCGAVATAMIIKDRESGRSKGFGFVEMENADDAKAAIEKLNGSEFKGRPLVVNEARPREDRR